MFFFTPELIVALLCLCFLFVNYLMSFFSVGFLNLLIKPISDSFLHVEINQGRICGEKMKKLESHC